MDFKKDFPILKSKVNGQPLIYFDNAATSQKPQCVIDAVNNYYKNFNSNVHRGVHELSQRATSEYESTRDTVRDFIGAKKSNQIIFTSSDIKPDAIKIGMLHSSKVIESVIKSLDNINVKKIILDPVMVAKGGVKLIDNKAIKLLKEKLIKRVTLITPNIPEAEILTKTTIKSKEDMIFAANKLMEYGAKNVLIKKFSEPIITIDTSTPIEKTAEEKLELGKPLDFDKNELHSFSEWLKITSFKPIERDETSEDIKEESDSLRSACSRSALLLSAILHRDEPFTRRQSAL